MREDLSDGILVGAVKSCVLGAFLSTLIETLELVHCTVCVCVCVCGERERERERERGNLSHVHALGSQHVHVLT